MVTRTSNNLNIFYTERRTIWQKLLRFFIIVVCLGVIGVAGFGFWYWTDFKHREAAFDDIINETAQRYNMPPALIKAVIRTESSFRKNAVGGVGEIGLMQLRPGPNFAVADWEMAHKTKLRSDVLLYDPRVNIEIGTWYLSRGRNQYADYRDCFLYALVRYNAGEKAAKRGLPKDRRNHFSIKKITKNSTNNEENEQKSTKDDAFSLEKVDIVSTENYVNKVMKYWKFYEKENLKREKNF